MYGFAVYKGNGFTTGIYLTDGYVSSNYVAFNDASDAGEIIFSTASVAWLQIDNFLVPADTTITRDYPELAGWNIQVFMDLFDQPPDAQEHYSPIASVSGTTVTVGPQPTLNSFAARAIVIAQG
jgi:hypothetical protein